MAKRITEEQKAKIRELTAKGIYTQKEIAETVGCSTVAVGKYGKEESEEEESEESGEEDVIISGTSVEDYYEKIIDAKDDHIKNLQDIITQLTGILAGAHNPTKA